MSAKFLMIFLRSNSGLDTECIACDQRELTSFLSFKQCQTNQAVCLLVTSDYKHKKISKALMLFDNAPVLKIAF